MLRSDPSQFETAMTSISAVTAGPVKATDIIQRSLEAARAHLDLEVAYLSQFEGDETVFRHVDAPGLEDLVKVGDRKSLDDVYCRHILEGRLPELIPDTSAEPLAVSMPITAAVPIGAHVSVPVRLRNGDLYGMFCCLGPQKDATLNNRDLRVMRCFADMAAMEIDRNRESDSANSVRLQQVQLILSEQLLDILYQPIWDTHTNRPIAFEALSRFRTQDPKTPDLWFAEAKSLGLGVALELLAIAKALDGLENMPGDAYLTVNCSPQCVMSPELPALLTKYPLKRIAVEITEHEMIEDAAELAKALEPLRRKGLRIAVDDAGSGYSGLQQILELKPDVIKLDRFFVRSIETDPSRQAMALALASFSQSVRCSIIAEGVETQAELRALGELGFHHIQGYLLGKPEALSPLPVLAVRD